MVTGMMMVPSAVTKGLVWDAAAAKNVIMVAKVLVIDVLAVPEIAAMGAIPTVLYTADVPVDVFMDALADVMLVSLPRICIEVFFVVICAVATMLEFPLSITSKGSSF